MPVDVPIALLTPHAQQIQTLGGDNFAQCPPDLMYERLQLDVLPEREVTDHLFSMLDRCDKDVTLESRVARKKHEMALVAVDDFVPWRALGREPADEARAWPRDLLDVRRDVQWSSWPDHLPEVATGIGGGASGPALRGTPASESQTMARPRANDPLRD